MTWQPPLAMPHCPRSAGGAFLTAAKTCVPCGDGCERCASATTCAQWCAPSSDHHSVHTWLLAAAFSKAASMRAARGYPAPKPVQLLFPCSFANYALSPQKKCLACSPSCSTCKYGVATGRTRCTSCYEMSLVNGECRRCDDPRCGDCSGNVRVCKRCRDERHVVNKATGRCEDPAWPPPCPAVRPGRRGGCATSPVRSPARKPNSGAGRWAKWDASRAGCWCLRVAVRKVAAAAAAAAAALQRLHCLTVLPVCLASRQLQGAVVRPAIIGGRNATKGR